MAPSPQHTLSLSLCAHMLTHVHTDILIHMWTCWLMRSPTCIHSHVHTATHVHTPCAHTYPLLPKTTGEQAHLNTFWNKTKLSSHPSDTFMGWLQPHPVDTTNFLSPFPLLSTWMADIPEPLSPSPMIYRHHSSPPTYQSPIPAPSSSQSVLWDLSANLPVPHTPPSHSCGCILLSDGVNFCSVSASCVCFAVYVWSPELWPWDVHTLITRIDKRDFADMINGRELEVGDNLGLLWVIPEVQSHHMGPIIKADNPPGFGQREMWWWKSVRETHGAGCEDGGRSKYQGIRQPPETGKGKKQILRWSLQEAHWHTLTFAPRDLCHTSKPQKHSKLASLLW